MQEQGFDGFEATTWYGLAGPGKLPIGDRAEDQPRRQHRAGDARRAGTMDTYGAEDGGGSSEKFATFIHTEIVKWAKVVKDADVKIES